MQSSKRIKTKVHEKKGKNGEVLDTAMAMAIES